MPKIKYIALFISILFCGLLPGPTKAEVLTLPLLNAESGKGTPSFFATGMRSGHSVILTAYSVSCNDSCDGSVKATVSGGVGPFSYDWIGSPPGSPLDSIFTLCNGNYSVVVYDLSDGSFIFSSVDVLEPPELGAIFIPASPGTNCFGICDGASTAIGTGGNGGPYTYAWNNPASENTAVADSLCPGDNIVTIWDCCGCVGTDTVTLAEPPQLLANVGGLDILCNGACNGQVWGVPTGGTPGYTHSWNTGSTDDTLFNLCPGAYVDTVRDLNGCISIQSFVVTQPASLTLTMDSTNESCGGLCDGVVRVTVVGGSTPYAYVWNDFFVQTNDSAFALCVGMYTVIVTDAAGCSDTDSIAVGSPPVLTVTTDTIHVLCATDSTGSAIALPVGGDGTYFYIWDDVDAQTTATATNLPDGTYCVTVTDGLGCTNSACAEVLEPPLLDVDATGTNVTCNGACDGIGTPIFSGGVTPYAFQWDDPALQTNAVATNICATDTICVTLTDANGCIDTSCIMIIEPTVLTTIETKTDESCNGACDGTGTITASGGTLPYAYLWCNGNTSSTATALCAGKCYVTVTDNNGCSVVDSVIIIAPPILDVTATFVDPLCGGVCDGTAEAFPVGGTAPYAYSWTPPPPPIQTTKIATGLCSGVYTVEVTDDNGCQDATTVTITPPVILTLSMDSTLISCNGADDGTGTANPGGGTGPYAYLWDDPLAQTTQIATNLPPGTWCVTVTDAAGCTISGCRDFVDPPLLTVAMSKTDISCFGLCDGTGTATPAGGTLPYFYIWDDPLAQTNALATGLCAGPVNVTVTDNNGCTVIGTVTIIEPSDINPNITTLPSTCGNSDGSACVAPTGGTPCALPTPYGINWYTLPAFTSCIVLQAAGSYGVEITDCNGCIDSSSAFIADIASHTVVMSDTDVTCAEDSNGIGLGLATLGTPPYAYQWLDNSGTPIVGETDSVIFNLWPGTYILQIGDALGCTIFDTVFITQPDSLFANLTAVDVLCFGDNNGSASTVPSGGIAPYTYMWETGAITSTISALFPGWYTDTLRDNNGCLVIDSVEVNSQLVLTLATDTVHVLCNGDATGMGIVSVIGGVPLYTYQWDAAAGSQANDTAFGLVASPTHYVVVVTDGNLCTSMDSVIVLEPPALTLSLTKTDVACFGICNGTATATVGGGAGIYTYVWSDLQSTSTATALCNGLICVTVTDGNNCTISACITINQPGALSALMSNSDVSCFGFCDATGTAVPSGGTGPYTFAWDNAPDNDITPTADSLCAGTWSVTITDNNTCTLIESVVVTQPDVLVLTKDSVAVTCNGGCDGIADVNVSGGTAPYTILWDPGTGNQTDSTAIGLCAGTYLVTVNDFQGCVDSTSVIIVEPLPLIPNFTTLDATCGVCDGEASSAPAGGTAPYTFNWFNAFFASPPGNDTIFLQCAGFRDLEITDDSNCVDTFTVGINNFGAPIIDSVDSAGISCFGECDGVAIVYVQPLSGSPPYTYAWSTSPDTIDTATGLCVGTTIVQVTDFLNCIVTEDIIITGPTPIVSLITGTNISCFGACDGTASVTPFGGEPPYTYLWFPGGQTTPSISSTCMGTVSCRITDSTGCIIQDTIILTEPAVFNVSLVDSTNISCFGACDGIITVTVTGGTGPYAYLWDDPFGQTNSVANGICGDSITKVVVTDAQGCQDSLTVTLSQPALLVATIIDSNNVTCFGFCNGDATVGLVGGTTPYAFLWNNSPSDDTTALADTLCAGILYKVIVTDTLGCQDSTTVMLSEPAVLTATVTDSTNANCNGVCDGTATVVAAGGSGTYTYSWDNIGPDSITVADSLCAGTMYHITVVDSLNCIALDSVTLSEPTVLGVTISNSTNISCKDACDGTARGTVTGGTAPYTYVWSNGDADTLADSLCAGVPHMLTVTDSLGCMDSVTVTLTEPDSLLINIFDSVNATCFGVCDGIARTVTTGGTLSYTYVWSLTSDTLDSAIALCADTMNIVIVTDSNGCTASDSVMLSQPLEIFATITDSTDANCFGVCDGQAVITGSGGNPPLSFLWQSGETNDTALALCAVDTLYGVVLDSLGCTDTAFFSISQPTDIIITFTDSSAALCNGGCEGDATIAVSGGSTPYTLIWDNGDSGVFADTLCAGYTVINVTDSIGCVKSDSINIIEPLLFVVDTVSTTSAACDSSCNAMAVVFGTGGTTPYTFTWSDSLPTVNDTAINLCASTYIVTAVDSNGCAATDTIVLFGPDSLTIVITDQKNATCAGATDGEGTVQAGGGVLPYTYTWIDTSIVPGTIGGPGPNDTTLTGLGAGTYFAVVTDGNGCKATVPVVITEPLPLQANVCFTKNVTCFGVCNGIAAVCPVGGTAPFTYLWDDPLAQTTDSAVGLCADTLGIMVTDSNGCIALDSLIIIEEPGLLSCLFTNAGNTGCGVDSAIGFAVTQGLGGSPPYTYLWNTTPPGTSDSVGNLLAGSYTVAVIDTNNCTSFCSITISDTSDMSAAITDSTMVSCYGVCDGGAVVTASGSTQPYSYNWLDVDSVQIGQTNDTASALCAGFYRAIVKSNAACFRSVPITITEPDSLVAFISDTLNVLCNADSNGRLVVAPTGGTPPYTYAWFDSTGTQIDSVDTLAGLPAGPYDVVVVDSNGCTDSSSAIVSEPLQLFVGVVSTVQPACSNTCDGLMVADASGGTTPYAYLWLPDSIADDSLPNACVDTFIITVTDTNGCFASDTVNLNPVVTIVANGGPDTQVCEFQQLVLTADTAGSTFQWYLDTVVVGDTLSTNATLTTVPLVSGWHQYILVVGDSICSDTDSVAVYIIPVAVDACCETTLALGECIELTGTVTNGAIYSWSPGITLNDPNIFNPEACPLENTTYTLTATNDSGCVGTDTVTITINPDIPDGFTPQGDGFNDVWELNLLSNYKDAEVQVYNRWGQLVFDSPRGDQYATKFDGTFNGEDLPVGTYYFVIKLNDAANTEAITGPITIMR